MFSIGLFSNPWLFVGVLTMTASQLVLTYSPPLQQLFGTANLGVTEWLLILAIGVAVFIVVEIEKRASRSSGIAFSEISEPKGS